MAKKRNGGLGRGLAALIPTDDRPAGPRLGDCLLYTSPSPRDS